MPETALISLVAALTTWVTLMAWSPFSERPSSYLVPLLGVCLLIAVSGALLRALRLHPLLVLLGQLALVGLVLHHAWAGGHGLLDGWLPTPASVREVGDVLGQGVDASRDYPAPVPKDVTELAPLLVLAGSATALLVDFIACGLRRAPVAGLPLLAVYTAPVSILDGGVSWLKFALAGLSFLFLLTCQEESRLAHWGQQATNGARVFDSQQTRVSSRAIWTSARKIGFTATALAVVAPVLVPSVSLGLFDGSGSGNGGGGASVSLQNPIVDMKRDLTQGPDVDVVRVVTDDPDPTYMRTAVLDDFDGETWKPSPRGIPVTQRAEGLIPRPPGLDPRVARTTYRWDVQTFDTLDTKWLPAPYPVFSLDAPGDWRYDRDTLDFYSAVSGQGAAGVSYDLERLDLEPTASQLVFAGPAPAEIFGPNTEVPDSVPDSVGELAASVTSGVSSKFEKAQMLQRWFRVDGGFSYSTDRAPGNGADALVNFLKPGGRTGYCEQFAAAMALMGRTLGIPSRVATGFLRPDPKGSDVWVFSARDLHAWPEMYFEGVGWLRFEPTPGGRTGAVPAYTRLAVDQATPSSSSSASSLVSAGPNRIDRSATPAGGTGSGSGSTWDSALFLGSLGGTLVLLVLLALPRTVRSWLRSRRWAAAGSTAALAEAAWAELRDCALDLGVAWDDRVTVRTRARELVRGFGMPGQQEDALSRAALRGHGANPDAEAALRRLVALVERARFARVLPADDAGATDVRADLDRCVAALGAGAGRRRRTRATWLPASLWSRWTSAAGRRRAATAVALGDPGVDHAV
jgi:transglutaminase-like putative cysteine protease